MSVIKDEDLISIIIPVYNAERYLKDTITSVKNQTYQNWELIIVDDCSSDNSKNIIDNFSKIDKRIQYIKQEKNSGSALARNRGIDLAKGKFLCFLDADDLWEKNKLEKQVNFMKTTNCAFSYHSYEFANEYGNPTGKKVIAKNILNYRQALKNNLISTITVMFNMDKINKKLIKMPNLKYVEDTATWWKILRSGYDAYGMENVYSYYRRTRNSQSSQKIKTQRSLWYLYRKVEKLNFIDAFIILLCKNFHAIMRRI